MRALIVGGDSVIGTALGAALSAQGHGVLASTRRPARFLAAQLGFDADTVVRPDLAAANHVRPFAHAALDCSSTNATFHLPSPTAQTALSWLAGHLQAETP